MEELLEPCVLSTGRPVAKNHLCRQGIGVQADKIDEVFWMLHKADQHRVVLQVLVRHIGLCCVDIEGLVHDFCVSCAMCLRTPVTCVKCCTDDLAEPSV